MFRLVTRPIRYILGTGFLFGREELTNFEFNPSQPYTACMICGRVFQTELDRRVPAGAEPWHKSNSVGGVVAWMAYRRRRVWADKHARTHSSKEHQDLKRSGLLYTPEAGQKLAAFGLISFVDLVVNEEVKHALATASRAPADDAES